MSPDESLRASLEAEGFVFEYDWHTLQTKILQAVDALHGRGHAEMFARNLGCQAVRHHRMRTGIVDVLAQFMESPEEANLLMSVYGEEVLAGYTEILRVLRESGGAGRVIEFGAWTGGLGHHLLRRKLAKVYVGVETADRVVELVAARRSPKAFRLQTPPRHDVKNGQADWLVCTLGLHRRSDYLFDEDDELTPLPIEYQDERVVAQAKEYYAGFFASVASVVHSNTRTVITQPIQNFAELWGFACAARDAGWSLAPESCRCVWGGRRFATLVFQRGEATNPMMLPDAACWWSALVAPFSTSMTALSDVALGEYFALEDRVPIHSGQVGRSAVEVGFYKQGAYAIHSASPGGFTLFMGMTEREVHSQLHVYCDSRGEELSDSPWPQQGVVPSSSGTVIATVEQQKPPSPQSNKEERNISRDTRKLRVKNARSLDIDRLRALGAVFPSSLKDAKLRKLTKEVLRDVDDQELRHCATQTLKALAPELYKQLLVDEIVAAQVVHLRTMDLDQLRGLHATKCGAPPRAKKKLAGQKPKEDRKPRKPARKDFVRGIAIHDEGYLMELSVAEVELLHRKEFVPLPQMELCSRLVEDLWYIDAKLFLQAKAKRFEAALGSPPLRGAEIRTWLSRWLKGEEAKFAKAKATVSDPELLFEQQTVVDDLAELLIQAKGSKKGESSGRIRLSEKERAEFGGRWRQDGGLSEFIVMLEYKGDLSRTENLHRCYDALHRIVEGARTNVEDWEEKFPELADLGISKGILRIRNLVRVQGIDSDGVGKPKGEGRGVRLMQRILLPKSKSHITAIHVVQEGLLDELGKGLDVTTIRRLLAETPTPLAWLPEFLLWRRWRRSVEQGRASIYKLRVSFDKDAGGLGVPDDAIDAVRMFLLRCEYGFLHMLNRYPDKTPVRGQANRALAQLPSRQKRV